MIRDTNDPRRIASTYAVTNGYGRGSVAGDGRAWIITFQTVLPPNSPNCATVTPHENNNGIYNAASNHSGGVNTLFVDGSVKFISETIDCGDMTKPSPTVGQSPFGVWGAYGSVNGGETKGL